MTDEEEELYSNTKICRFCEKKIESDKVRDHCHITGKYRGPAHSKCNINVTKKHNKFIPFLFHNFSNSDCHLFFKKFNDKKNDKVKFDIIPKSTEECISVTKGCIRLIDSYRFLSSNLDSLVKTLVDNSHKTLKNFKEEIVDKDEIVKIVNETKKTIEEDRYNIDSIKDLKTDSPDKIMKLEEALLNHMGENDLEILKEFPDNRWKYLNKKSPYPYEYFNSFADYQKAVDNLKKEDFFSKLKNKCPDDIEIERTKEFFIEFNGRNGEEVKRLY